MQEYCENQMSCRRQVFSEKFTEVRLTAHRCGKMCDNCAAKLGSARRNFLPISLSGSSADQPASKKRSLEMSTSRQKSTSSSMKDAEGWEEIQRPEPSSRQPNVQQQPPPRATFIKASQLMNNSSNQGKKAVSAPQQVKSMMQSKNENVINLLDDDDDGGPSKRGKR